MQWTLGGGKQRNPDTLPVVNSTRPIAYKQPLQVSLTGRAMLPGYGTKLKTVCGLVDTRVKVDRNQYFPFKYICNLDITFMDHGTPKRFAGTGFVVGDRCVLTAGHCVHDQTFGWASSIVVYPGYDGSTAPFGQETSSDLAACRGWVDSANRDVDCGAIFLPDNSLVRSIREGSPSDETNGSTKLWWAPVTDAGRVTALHRL